MSSGDIVQLINSYTTQLEEYDRLSTNYVTACVSLVCVLIGILVVLMNYLKKEEYDEKKKVLSKIISALFLIFAPLTALFMYCFDMNCRKVVLYRGYLSYLENMMNQQVGDKVAFFNSDVVIKYLSIKNSQFYGLNFGPFLMFFSIAVILCLSFGFSLYYARKSWLVNGDKEDSVKNKYKYIFIIVWCVFLLLCVALVICSGIDLMNNEAVMKDVTDFCIGMK